jgi:hypothetical protein
MPDPAFNDKLRDVALNTRHTGLEQLIAAIESVNATKAVDDERLTRLEQLLAVSTTELITTACGRATKTLAKAAGGTTPTKERIVHAGKAIARLSQPHNVIPSPDGDDSSIAARGRQFLDDIIKKGNQDDILAGLLKLDEIQLPANKVQSASVESRFRNAFAKLDQAAKLAMAKGDSAAAAELLQQLANAHEMWCTVYQPLCAASTSAELPLQLLSEQSFLCTTAATANTHALAFLANLRNPAFRQAVKSMLDDKTQHEGSDRKGSSSSKQGRAWEGKGALCQLCERGVHSAKNCYKFKVTPVQDKWHKSDKKEGQ